MVNSVQYEMYFSRWENETNPLLYTIRSLSENIKILSNGLLQQQQEKRLKCKVKSMQKQFKSKHFKGPILCKMNVTRNGGKKIHIHPATLLLAPLLRRSQRNALFWKVTLCDEQNEIVKCPTERQFLCSRRGLNMPHMVYTSFFYG